MSEIAAAGDRLAAARLQTCADDATVEVRRGPGWAAYLTGVASNDWNGIVCTDPDLIHPDVVDALVGWFGEAGLPACWLNLRPDPRLGALLAERGLRPERTGSWAGLELGEQPAEMLPVGVELRPVGDPADLDRWLDAAESCGWLNGDADRRARRRLYGAHIGGNEAWSYWIALEAGRAVAMASSFSSDSTIELCTLAVVEDRRGRGIGGALTSQILREGVQRGARLAVTAPSPEGWELYRRRGFVSIPVIPDVCWYLP